jgi:hypothetical protein
MCLSLTQYLSVADNARDAVLLHVSAASEKQERRNETGVMTKKKDRLILTHIYSCDPCVLCFYTVQHLVEQST